MNDFIDNFVIQLIESGLSSKWGILGCTDVEIREIETRFDIELPAIYKAFLRKIGDGRGTFLKRY